MGTRSRHGRRRAAAAQTEAGLPLVAFLAVFGTYFHFLIFTEFSLLELAGGLGALAVTGGLAGGGLLGSALAALLHHRGRGGLGLLFVFMEVAGVLACTAPWWARTAYATVPSFAEGLALGGGTVTLALALRALCPSRHLGLVIGAGTGLAYALANVPWVFSSGSVLQSIMGGAGAFVAAGASLVGARKAAPLPTRSNPVLFPAALPALAGLAALVWFDSAAFFVIQHVPAYKGLTWSGDGVLWGNALIHAAVALVSGWLLDRGFSRLPLIGAWGLLAVGVSSLQWGGLLSPASGLIYAAGVSFYSVALVWEAARRASPLHAALLFGLAGWLGSGLGIGMAQELERVPVLFLVISAGVVGLLFIPMRKAAGVAVSMFALCVLVNDLQADEASVLRGREIYQAEGCIQCHSQYVRAGVGEDEVLYGPARPVGEQLAGAPPLVGNRRLGPDLSNIANRRSRAWNKLHLCAPRTLVPGSRMPSYAGLFSDGDARGEALLDYLMSLGEGTLEPRRAIIATWQPRVFNAVGDASRGALSWSRNCVSCHGRTGVGDGALAGQLEVRPPDFSRDDWRRVPRSGASHPPPLEVMRIVKFGIPGSPMPGHEWLSEQELADLASHVLLLHSRTNPTTP